MPKGQKIAYDLLPQNRPRQYLLPPGSPTIPHKYSKNKASCFPAGCADAAEEDGRRGSNVYEVNPWLWQFGGGKPRMGGLTIEETAEKQDAASKSSDKRRKETREGRKGDSA